MKNRIKIVLSWCLVIVAFFASVFSPLIVFATTVSDAQNANRYDELAEIIYLAKIADACNPKANDSDVLPLTGPDATVEARNKLKNFYNMNFTYNNTTLYDSYLETLGQGKYDNGSVYCKQIRENVNVVPKLLNKLGLYSWPELGNIACGRNNEGGLFKIRMGYYCGGLGCDRWGPDGRNASGQWPENWPTATNDGYTTDCKAALERVRYFTEQNTSAEISSRTTRFEVKFEINDSFSFQDYLSDSIGDYSSIINELTQANQYLNLMSSCSVTEISKSDYEANIENGANKGNQFIIYHDGQTKYILLAVPARSVYWNLPGSSLTSENKSTCKELAEALSPDGATAQNLIDNERLGQVRNCYDAAVENIPELRRVGTFVRAIETSAKTLLGRAETMRDSDTYGTVYFDPNKYSADYMEGYARKLTEDEKNDALPLPSALEGFINTSRSFEEKIRAYYEKMKDGELTAEEKEDLQAEIDNYIGNINTYKENVIDKVDDALKRIPELSMDSVQIYGPVQAGQSHIKDKVENFYEFDDEDNFTCLITEEILPGIATEIENATGADISMTEYVPPNRDIYSDDSTGPVDDPCYNAGVEGMSWILCPALNNMVEATDGISGLLDSWLAVDSGYYSDTSSAREAWGYFRDIANVAVIIVLLVIIVSQVTGYGIDNYGIKKMLPKLLVMAVMINLSFLVCQLAIDLSNILGSGLNEMFKSIGLTINSGVGGAGVIGGIVDGIFAALGIVGAGSATAITIVSLTAGGGGGVMVVIFVILMVITALIAVLMFFLALGARFIIILVFTAIAPLAFACYILPNTQNLFKQWWKTYRTALVIYPICGALYGVSFIIRGILFKNGTGTDAPGVDLWLAMIGIAAPFLPFLVLPSLTKGALASLGVIGGTLSSLGNGLKSGLSKGQNALQNTASFKNAQEQSARNLNYKMAGLKRNKETGAWEENKNIGKFGRFIRGGKTGMAAAQKRVLADERARRDEDLLANGGFEAGLVAQRKAAEAEDVSNWETLIKDKTRDGADENELFKLYDDYVKKGNASGARAVARIAGRRKDTAARFMDRFTATDFTHGRTEEEIAGRQAVAQSVAKEIAEGANSRTYLSSAPIKFDFASQINRDQGSANYQYGAGEDGAGWLNSDVVDDAMSNYVTNSSELVGVKGSSLEDMMKLMGNGGMSAGEVKRLQILATETIANRDKGPWDSTKAEALCAMSGGAFEFDPNTKQIIDKRSNVSSPAETTQLNIPHEEPTGGAKPMITTNVSSEELSRLKLEADRQNQGNRKYPGNGIILP